MSVHWKPMTPAACPCGRLHSHDGCGMEVRFSAPKKAQKAPDAREDFWSHDHYGLMPRFQEERR